MVSIDDSYTYDYFKCSMVMIMLIIIVIRIQLYHVYHQYCYYHYAHHDCHNLLSYYFELIQMATNNFPYSA